MEELPTPWTALDRAWEDALRRVVEADRPTVVLFSGGIDSGLIAWDLRRTASIRLFTLGMAGSSDLAQAREASVEIGVPWLSRVLTGADLAEVEATGEGELADVAPPRRSIFVALASAFARAPPGRLVCGQGADELFLGYAHYRGLPPASAAARAQDDLATLQQDDWPRTRRLAARWGREVFAPFLDEPFVRLVRELPIADQLPGTLTKPLLRRWAAHRGVPSSFVERPKRAVQYGSGIDRWMRQHRTV